MEDFINRIIGNLVDRLHGPLGFRFILQPMMAIIFAVLDGLKDAKLGRPPYFWAVLLDASHRRELMRHGWKSIRKVFIFAAILDVIYQIIVLHRVYPGETLIVAFYLAIVPYLFVRGPTNRLFSWIQRRSNRKKEEKK